MLIRRVVPLLGLKAVFKLNIYNYETDSKIIVNYKYILFFFNSCDILEENPKDFVSPQQFFTTEDEVLSSLYGVYEFMHNEYIGDYMKIFIGDLGVDEMLCRSVLRLDACINYTMESPSTEYSDIWRVHYKAIGAANMMISRTLNSNLDDNFKNKVVSEAKVLRSFLLRIDSVLG